MTHLKYDIGAMMHIIKDTNEKVQALISQTNNGFMSSISLKQNGIDMMNIFPLTNDDELMDIEKKISNPDFRNELVTIH